MAFYFVGSSGSDDPPPPKPSRFPNSNDVSASNSSLASTAVPGSDRATVSTYIVAQNPEVLVHLLRENESRGLNPSVYTTPASAFNTLAVDFKTKACTDESDVLSAGSSTQNLVSDFNKTSLSQNSQSSSDLNAITSSSCTSTLNKSLPRNFGGKISKMTKTNIVGGGRKISGSSEEMGGSSEDDLSSLSSREVKGAATTGEKVVKLLLFAECDVDRCLHQMVCF